MTSVPTIAANVDGSAVPGQKPPPESFSPDGGGVSVVPGPGSPASPVSTKPDALVIPPQHQSEQRRQTEHGQHLPAQAGRCGAGDACEPGDGEVDESHGAVLFYKRIVLVFSSAVLAWCDFAQILLGRMPADPCPAPTCFHDVRVIHIQGSHGCPSYRG